MMGDIISVDVNAKTTETITKIVFHSSFVAASVVITIWVDHDEDFDSHRFGLNADSFKSSRVRCALTVQVLELLDFCCNLSCKKAVFISPCQSSLSAPLYTTFTCLVACNEKCPHRCNSNGNYPNKTEPSVVFFGFVDDLPNKIGNEVDQFSPLYFFHVIQRGVEFWLSGSSQIHFY